MTDWTDKRPIEELNFGSEWEPKLIHFMEQHSWSDSAYTFVKPEGMKPEDVTEEFKASQLAMWKRRMAGIPTEEALKAWKDSHALKVDAVRAILKACGCVIAEDIKKLGCTGVAAHHEAVSKIVLGEHKTLSIGTLLKIGPSDHFSVAVIRFLRIGLAGSGVGLPCFVPPERYCHGHEVIGGLQDKQEQFYVAEINNISRDLRSEERAHNELIREAQHASEERSASDVLRGRRMPEGWLREDFDSGEAMFPVSPMTSAAASSMPDVAGAARVQLPQREVTPRASVRWQCPEHDEPNWKCRYCVAQMIVEGPLEPAYVLETPGVLIQFSAAADVDRYIADHNDRGVACIDVYVSAATFRRKLARD